MYRIVLLPISLKIVNEICTCTGISGICYEHNCKIMDTEDYQTTRLKTIYYTLQSNNLDKVVLRIS